MKGALIIFLCMTIFSCSGIPKSDDAFHPLEPVEMPREETGDEAAAPLIVQPPDVLYTEALLPEEPLAITISDEPQFELAETDAAVKFPEEIIEIAALPEPAIPVIEPAQTAAQIVAPVTERLFEMEAPVAEKPLEPASPVVTPPSEPARTVTEPPREPLTVAEPPPEPIKVSPPVIAETPKTLPTAKPFIPPPPALLGPAEEKKQDTAREPAIQTQKEAPAIPWVNEASLPSIKDSIIFSRTVRATVGQIVEIPFRGTGWVYLGELASRRGVVYDSRRLDPEGQSFLFRTEEIGTYSLKFYKQDFIRDYILNDYVQVIVGEAPVSGAGWFNPPFDRGRAVAEPRWPSTTDEAELQKGSVLKPSSETRLPSVFSAPQESRASAAGTQKNLPDARPQLPTATGPSAVEGSPPAAASSAAVSEPREKALPETL
ncbi:MAG: hypothetical protein LBU82_08390, partial [Treponema sp.]|nr:hypothetical protein [Treponema sp.]